MLYTLSAQKDMHVDDKTEKRYSGPSHQYQFIFRRLTPLLESLSIYLSCGIAYALMTILAGTERQGYEKE